LLLYYIEYLANATGQNLTNLTWAPYFTHMHNQSHGLMPPTHSELRGKVKLQRHTRPRRHYVAGVVAKASSWW